MHDIIIDMSWQSFIPEMVKKASFLWYGDYQKKDLEAYKKG